MDRMASGFEHPDDESPGLLLWRVTNRWQAAIRAALRPHDLTHVQFVLLAHLAWLPDDRCPTQAELAALAQTDPMMTSQVLRALEGKGLVDRLRHPTDGRARLLAATPEGRALADCANRAVEAADADFFGSDGASLAAALRPLDGRPDAAS